MRQFPARACQPVVGRIVGGPGYGVAAYYGGGAVGGCLGVGREVDFAEESDGSVSLRNHVGVREEIGTEKWGTYFCS